MAKLRGAGHSDRASGAFGKSLIFRHTKRGAVLTNYHKPGSANPFTPSPAQVAQRLKYGQAVQAWKALTTEEKAIFNENAVRLHISGWNLFFKNFTGGTPPGPIDGLISHYLMNDNANDNVISDALSYDNGVANFYTSDHSVTGKINQAIHLDGAGDYIDFGTPTNFYNLDTFTACFWVKKFNFGWFYGIFGCHSLNDSSNFHINFVNSDHVQVDFGQGMALSSDEAITDSDWHWVCVTYDKNDSAKMYIDNVLQTITTANNITWNDTSAYVLGRYYSDQDDYYSEIDIDDVRFYNRVLTSDERALLAVGTESI